MKKCMKNNFILFLCLVLVLSSTSVNAQEPEQDVIETETSGTGGEPKEEAELEEEPGTEAGTEPQTDVTTEEGNEAEEASSDVTEKDEKTKEAGEELALEAEEMEDEELAGLSDSYATVLSELQSYTKSAYANPTFDYEWFVLATARHLNNTSDAYLTGYVSNITAYISSQKGVLANNDYSRSNYSRVIIGLTAAGVDATNVAGYNLFDNLSDLDLVTKQGINGAVWALNAVNTSESYGFGDGTTTEEGLVNYLLSKEISGGGFAYSGTTADVDMTAMVITSLAPYYNSNSSVKAAIDRGIKILSDRQQDDGGFITNGGKSTNAESCAQVVLALCTMGINPETDARFVKNGISALDNLLSFHIEKSGMRHVAGGSVNGLATAQGFYALVAYERFAGGQSALFDIGGTNLKPVEDPDASGDDDSKTSDGETDGSKTGDSDDTDDSETSGSKKSTTKKSGTKTSSSSNKKKSKKSGKGKTYSLSGKISTEKAKENRENFGKKKKKGWDFDAEYYADDETAVISLDDRELAENTDEKNEGEVEVAESEGLSNPAITALTLLLFAMVAVGSVVFIRRRRDESDE